MRRLLIACLVLLLAGCSNSESTSEVPYSTTQPPQPPGSAALAGKLYLGGSIGGAAVRVEALDGTPLGSATTGQSGNFFLPVAPPRDFRVLVTPAGSDQEFAAEVRGYQSHLVFVNVPTTLASRYLRSHPGATLEDAEARTRRVLNLPQGLNLSEGIEESPRNPFSHIAFWRAAGQAGGWAAYSATILGQMESASGRAAYVLTKSQLATPLTGLEAGLLVPAEAIRANLARTLVFSIESNAYNPANLVAGVLPKGELLAPADGDITGSFLFGCATGLGGNILTDAVGGIIGWAANQMGYNYGTSGQLNEIANDIANLSAEINQIALNSSITSAITALNSNAVGPIVNATNSLQSAAAGATVTNTPANPTVAAVNAINQVVGTDWHSKVGLIQDGMLGTNGQTNLIASTPGDVLPPLGLDQPSNMQGLGWRNNNLIDGLLSTWSKFYGYQVQGINLYVEAAHAATYANATADPAGSITTTQSFLEADTASLKTQRQQQPIYLPSDKVILDLEHGVMWYAEMQSTDTWSNANTFANNLAVTGQLPDGTTVSYDDWRLPTYTEMISLQNRGAYDPSYDDSPSSDTDKYPSYGRSTQGLSALGFTNVNSALSGSDNGKDGDLWFAAWNYGNGNQISLESDWEFRLNHNSTGDNAFGKSSKDQNPYLVCRTIGAPVLTPYLSYNLSASQITSSVPSALPSPVIGTALLPGELAAYGVVTGVAAPTLVAATAAGTTSSPCIQPNRLLRRARSNAEK